MGSRISASVCDLEMIEHSAPRRLNHFTPLRYPGGKAKLAPFVKSLLSENALDDGVYIEPFAGGAGIAMQLLLQGYVARIAINDLSWPIFAFWQSILGEPSRFIDLINNIPLTMVEWDRQKAILKNPVQHSAFEVGFAAFFLNRTNRSGVLNGGVIGGRDQVGEWLIDARFNRTELAYRIERISRHKDEIDLYNRDSLEFLQIVKSIYKKNQTFIYADPPYFVKGRQLYLDYYKKDDHAKLASFMIQKMKSWYWMVSYDDVKEVRDLYDGQALSDYFIPYSVRTSQMGSEVMFYSERMKLPKIGASTIGPADRFAV